MEPPRLRRAALALVALVALWVVVGATPAAATDGSVPAEVANYLATDLVGDLTEFYGPGADATGIAFDETTKAAPASRVFEFTADFRSGIDSKPVAGRLNEWISIVSVGDTPVGVAVVTINDATVEPQLAGFLTSPTLTTALATLPSTGMLVRDTPRSAWLIVDNQTLTPIYAGSSGLTAPTTTAEYSSIIASDVAATEGASPSADAIPLGLIIAGLVVLLVVALLAVERFLPPHRRRRHIVLEGEVPTPPVPHHEVPLHAASHHGIGEHGTHALLDQSAAPSGKRPVKPATASAAKTAATSPMKPAVKAAAKPAVKAVAAVKPGATAPAVTTTPTPRAKAAPKDAVAGPVAPTTPRAPRAKAAPPSAPTASETPGLAKPRTPRGKPAASD